MNIHIWSGVVYFGSGSEEGNAIRQEAQSLISDGLESKLLSVFQDLLSSSHPEHMVCPIGKILILVI